MVAIVSNQVYKIVCPMSGTVLDISGDNKSLVGNDWQATDRQKWLVVMEEGWWVVKNVATGLYVGIEGVAVNNLSAIAMLFVPNTRFTLDLYGGNAAPGTHVEVWEKLTPGPTQKWCFERVENGECRRPSLESVHSSSSPNAFMCMPLPILAGACQC
uniref:Protein kinase domain-containing protein n=1 Tax=Ganoderma boninense TaxID=34458 RepID=A0A5K1K3D5_9APHY|nr:Protein kinase domain-containing protein [Ganoderma boninense]